MYYSGKPVKRLILQNIFLNKTFVDSLNYKGYKSFLLIKLSHENVSTKVIYSNVHSFSLRYSKFNQKILSLQNLFFILIESSNLKRESYFKRIHARFYKRLFFSYNAFYTEFLYVMLILYVLPKLLHIIC